MNRTLCLLLCGSLLLWIGGCSGALDRDAPSQHPAGTRFINGRWFNGQSFDERTVYSVAGRLTFRAPQRIDETVDLGGTWVVPPFADAHNHSLGTGVEERDRNAIRRFLSDGVLYVKIQGNLLLTPEQKENLSINGAGSIDVALAQGTLTASGGFPILLIERVLLAQGYYPGYTSETLRDHRYFTIDSEAELEAKWPLIERQRGDFIKTFLWHSDEFEKRRSDPAFLGQRGLDPALLPKIVAKAHAHGLRVSTHVTTSADFHNAVAAGIDEVSHLPLLATTPIAAADARLAAERGITVVTTCAIVSSLPRMLLPKEDLATVLATQMTNLRILHEHGVPLAIGSDNVSDSSVGEVEYLRRSGAFDNLSLLRMWTETAAKTIFPERRIGHLREAYEANFLALEGNPLDDLDSVRRIRYRFKHGQLLTP